MSLPANITAAADAPGQYVGSAGPYLSYSIRAHFGDGWEVQTKDQGHPAPPIFWADTLEQVSAKLAEIADEWRDYER